MTNDVPERIWADPPKTFDGCDVWHSEPAPARTEYIRKDVADASILADRDACQNDEVMRAVDKGLPLVAIMLAVKAIRARGNTNALSARDAQIRAEALRDIKEKAIEIMTLEDGETEENLKGYGRGSYFAAKCILALIPDDTEVA